MRQFYVNLVAIILFMFMSGEGLQAQSWQQQVDLTIQVTLDTKANILVGEETIGYKNNSPDTLHFIWMHCWPNAYRNDKTAFSEQLLANNRTDFYFSNEEQRGYMNQLQFRLDGQLANTEDHPLHQDILKLVLPKPLAPGASTIIQTPFRVKLPEIFSRMGHHNGFYAITQWYPKPAVYDKNGWHPIPYLDQGEFYSEFGNYSVSITVPEKFMVAATGLPQDTLQNQVGLQGETLKTIRFSQNKIHDFAWFASAKLRLVSDTLILHQDKTIRINCYVSPEQSANWKNCISVVKSAIRQRSRAIGDYPYDVISLVDGYQGEGSGGMEYPTIAVINLAENIPDLEQTISHEIGHNWFYAALASNERQSPWLDEGLNTYYDLRFNKGPSRPVENWLLSGLESIHRDQAIQTPADSFNLVNYGLVAYYKAADWLKNLEAILGTAVFDSCMQAYYSRFKFSHVDAGDLRQVFETTSGKGLPSFAQLDSTGPLLPDTRKKLKPVFVFDFSMQQKHRTLGIGPLPGYNKYDGFMLGAFVHNYQLPLPRFRFFLAPLYGTKSGTLAGIGNLSYTIYPAGKIHTIELGIDAARFTGYETQIDAQKIKLAYNKLAPYLKLTAKEENPLSKRERYAAYKSFFFTEDEFNKKAVPRNLQQLKLYYADHRILYPYEIDAKIDITKDITRIGVTGAYYFNYAGKKGGLQVRFFAGKLFYNGDKTLVNTLDNDRYLLNLTGANGYEDYTYSNYFIGRNEFSGWMSQQIMMRDGGFKVRTDLNSNKVGKTDNWLTAINLNTTIPNRYNPLSLLPFKIPLKLFADIGTYAEAWDKDNEYGRFLFDAGLQLSFLKESINIYIPVFNSKVFRDYNKSVLGEKRFLKTISFSIDIQKFTQRKLLAEAGL